MAGKYKSIQPSAEGMPVAQPSNITWHNETNPCCVFVLNQNSAPLRLCVKPKTLRLCVFA